MAVDRKEYRVLPTIRAFHESAAPVRCIVGPVGSGKTTGAAWEGCYYIPKHLFTTYQHKCPECQSWNLEHVGEDQKINQTTQCLNCNHTFNLTKKTFAPLSKTRGVIIRNSYPELIDTTQATVFDWFENGQHKVQRQIYTIKYTDGFEVEILFRSCDRPEDVKKFKSLELTWAWIDESIEVPDEVKRMLKNRIGRYPRMSPVKYLIETTNPPDVEHPTYHQFDWTTPPPGPVPGKEPLNGHVGFWQPPGENQKNLNPSYYQDLKDMYRDNPDWLAMYVDGKPGVMVKGKLVYANFKRDYHVANEPLTWMKGATLYRGWDNTGNSPACVVVQQPQYGEVQILREFFHDKMGIVDFTKWVVAVCNDLYHGAEFVDYADPAGEAKYSKREGGFTSNADLMRAEGITPIPADNNWQARKEAVEKQLRMINGLVIDPGCIRLINGFMAGYCYAEIGTSGIHRDKPDKNRFSHVHDSLQYVLMKMMCTTTDQQSASADRAVMARYADQRSLGFI